MTIFIHIPKTGGTSIFNALQFAKVGVPEIGPIHRSHERATVLGPTYIDWDSHFSFTIVRNPWDRAVSWYYWHKIKDTYGLSFNDWIYAGCPTHVSEFDPIDQLAYFVDANNHDLVNYVGRFENLEETLRTLANRIGCACGPLEHIQRSQRPKRPYQQYYNIETAKLLADHTRHFIEKFGYQYE